MDLKKFADTEMLDDEFYSWGTINAVPWCMERYKPLYSKKMGKAIQAMTTPSNMHLLNLAVQCLEPGECYLEVGTWRGATLIGALLDNEAHGAAIDDDSMDEHDGDKRRSADVWKENIAAYGMTERAHYIEGRVPEIWSVLTVPPVGVYLFDGDKSTVDAAFAGLAGVVPFLARRALILVDDANDLNVRRAVWQFEQTQRGHTVKVLDIPTPGNCWPQFWDGVMALMWTLDKME